MNLMYLNTQDVVDAEIGICSGNDQMLLPILYILSSLLLSHASTES